MEIKDFYDAPELLKNRFPTDDDIPPLIKEGSLLNEKERNLLPDNIFALVTKDGLRKYACTDKANTALSVIYFLDYGQNIPEPLKKMAAKNLLVACRWYKLRPPAPLEKMAGKVERTTFDHTIEPEPPQEVEKPKHANYCLPEKEKYPIDSYRQVKEAIDYFEKYATRFDPDTRRQYCKNLEKRASELGIELPEDIKIYASNTPSSKLKIKEALARRMRLNPKYAKSYEKLAEKLDKISADVLARALSKLDKTAKLHLQWDESIEDPWKTCFRLEKKAVYSFTDSSGYIDEYDLKKLTDFSSQIEKAFGKDIAEAFKKDPVGTFDALPLDEKRVIITLSQKLRDK